MYDKLNITENHLSILSLFTKGFNKEFYIRETSREVNISPRTAQLILEDLEEKGVIKSKLKGKMKFYKLKNNETTLQYLVLTENYKLICFLKENQLIQEILEKMKINNKTIVAIFGSYVKKTNQKNSDLDLIIFGNYNSQLIKEAKKFGISLDIKKYPHSFLNSNKEDFLINEVLEDHVLFRNAEQFVRASLKWIK